MTIMLMAGKAEVLMEQVVPPLVVLLIGLRFLVIVMAPNGIWNLKKEFRNGLSVKRNLLIINPTALILFTNLVRKYLAPNRLILIIKKFASK